MPKLRETVISLVSFGLFGGGTVGTFVNGKILDAAGVKWISKVIDVGIHGKSNENQTDGSF